MEIALIAHDGKKAEMVNFLMKHKEALNNNNITFNHCEKYGFGFSRFLQ